jgi:hypothetical protein
MGAAVAQPAPSDWPAREIADSAGRHFGESARYGFAIIAAAFTHMFG